MPVKGRSWGIFRRGQNTRSRQYGFTLIEVLVVIAILSLSLALLVGRGPLRSPTLNLRAAAGQVAAGLRTARGQAIARNHTVPFVLDIVAGGFHVGDGPVQALPRGLRISMTAVADQTAGERLGAISFLPDGSSSGGQVALAAGDTRVAVGVDWLTGRVSVVDGR